MPQVLGFEDEEPVAPGVPLGWTLTGTWSGQNSVLTFGDGRIQPNEDFEEWLGFEMQSSLPTIASQVHQDDMELWTVLKGALGGASQTHEDDMESWVVLKTTVGGSLQTHEDDMESWQTLKTVLPGASVQVHTDDFESVRTALQVVVDPVLDRFTSSGPHNLLVNRRVSFSSTSQLPTGLFPSFHYWVVSVPSATEFTVSPVLGGTSVDMTDVGIGVHSVSYDPLDYWLEVNESL